MKHPPPLCALLLVQFLAGCPRCGKQAAPPASAASIHRFLPRVAEAVVVVPHLGRFGGTLRQLEGLKLASFAAQLQGFPSAQAYVSGAMEQLGIDLRSPDELARAGIDAARGAAVAIVSARRGYLVIATADLRRFREAARRLASNRLGATVETTREELGHPIIYFARPGEAAAALAIAPVEDGFALVAAEESVEELAGYASLSRPESLAEAQSLSAALTRLPPSPDVYLHVPTTSNLAGYGGLANCTFSAELTAEALHLRADVPRARATPQWAALLQGKTGPELIAWLPADAFLVARFGGDPLALAQLWPAGRDVLSNLEPGMEASVSLAPTATFSGMPLLDFRRTNPFQYFHLVALTAVRDPQSADKALDELPALAVGLGATVQSAQRDGHKVFIGSYSQGQAVHFAQVNGKVAAASPVERLDQTIAGLSRAGGAGVGPIADPELRKALSARPMGAVLDFPALARSIRELPPSAWGIGGFAIKATTVRWLDSLDDLRAVTAGAYSGAGAVEVEVDLRLVKR